MNQKEQAYQDDENFLSLSPPPASAAFKRNRDRQGAAFYDRREQNGDVLVCPELEAPTRPNCDVWTHVHVPFLRSTTIEHTTLEVAHNESYDGEGSEWSAIHSGEHFAEELKELGMSAASLAQLSRSHKSRDGNHQPPAIDNSLIAFRCKQPARRQALNLRQY